MLVTHSNCVNLDGQQIERGSSGGTAREWFVRSLQIGEWAQMLQSTNIIDATELGDLLELADVEHVIGADSQDQTGELHAVEGDPAPLDQQAITWCFALDYLPGEDHTIDKPADYDFWKGYQADFWPGPLLGWEDVDPQTLETRYRAIFDGPQHGATVHDFWRYRRIFYKKFYADGRYDSSITLVNWPQIDYWMGPLVGVPDDEVRENHRRCKQLSHSFLYWMQTEAPRHDRGYGYPGLRLRHDVVDTEDGLAKYVYVREARRIISEFTVLEQHIGAEQRNEASRLGLKPSMTVWVSAPIASICTPALRLAPMSTSVTIRFRFRSAR